MITIKKSGGAADLARQQLAAEGGASKDDGSMNAQAMADYSASVAEAAAVVDGGEAAEESLV